MTLGQQIKAAREQLKLSQADVARAMRVTVQAISQWENDKTIPKGDRMMLLADMLNLGLSDVMRGDLPAYRRAPEDKPQILAPILARHEITEWESVLAGPLEGVQKLAINWEPEGLVFAYEIDDRSMLPEYQIGDIVIFDTGLLVEPGDLVAAITRDKSDAHFRKFRRMRAGPTSHEEAVGTASSDPIWELVPLNSDYPTLSDNSYFSIVGSMMEHRRFRRREGLGWRRMLSST